VSERIGTELKKAAVALADELDYARAAHRLGVSEDRLRCLVSELEEKLCLRLFEPTNKTARLTSEGIFLIRVFREALIADRRN
jgi:DNA-binding transcriptional LysR family regulator